MNWADAEGARLVPLSALPPDQQDAVRASFEVLSARIERLAEQISGEGDAGRIAGHMMRLALVTPDGFDALHAADGQPVLVNWGHAAEGQDVPVLDPVQPEPLAAAPLAGAAAAIPAAAATTATAGSAAAAEAGPASDAAERRSGGGAGVMAWLLPVLLLLGLGYLIWLLMQPLEPEIVERELPPPDVEDPVPAARDRLAALREELAEAEALRDELGGLCEVIPQERAVLPPPEPEPEPRVTVIEPPKPPEEPPKVVEPAPAPEPKPVPQVRPRQRPLLPDEVPRVSEKPPQIAQLPSQTDPEPTLCEPGWTPTQRPEVMIVIDGSGSMQDSFPGASSRIDAAKRSVTGVVRNLHKDIKTGLVSFTDCGETSTPQKYSYSQRPTLLSRVQGVTPSRGTSLANSIRRAGNAAKSVGPATVVVVSDGEDTCGGDPCAAARALKASKPLLKVNVIDLSGGRSSVLQCVANVTGGRVFTPRNANQMNQEMQQATGQPDASRCNP
ncbi:VWA domain-containing protein [Minwuia sp.]|uniref:VWA domain-containing protein n=1 Tax=Minwuia sp. TaxID=2493630 RepID=UPI003A8F4E99